MYLDSFSNNQATKMPNTNNPISHLILLYLTSFCIQTPNTMNSALTLVSFQSPSFNLQRRPPSRHQQISVNSGTRKQCSSNPIRAILGPNATGGLSNAYRGGNTLPSSPLTDVIQEFYSSINDKDIKRLKKLLDPDCVVEHASYYKPLDTKVLLAPHFFILLQHLMVQSSAYLTIKLLI